MGKMTTEAGSNDEGDRRMLLAVRPAHLGFLSRLLLAAGARVPLSPGRPSPKPATDGGASLLHLAPPSHSVVPLLPFTRRRRYLRGRSGAGAPEARWRSSRGATAGAPLRLTVKSYQKNLLSHILLNASQAVSIINEKHKRYLDEIEAFRSNHSKELQEIKCISGELEESMAELEKVDGSWLRSGLRSMVLSYASGVNDVNGGVSTDKSSDQIAMPNIDPIYQMAGSLAS